MREIYGAPAFTWEEDAEPQDQVDEIPVAGHVPDGSGLNVGHGDTPRPGSCCSCTQTVVYGHWRTGRSSSGATAIVVGPWLSSVRRLVSVRFVHSRPPSHHRVEPITEYTQLFRFRRPAHFSVINRSRYPYHGSRDVPCTPLHVIRKRKR